jgi:phosphoribosylformylglycinamidine cyclo-ligase
LFYLQSHRKTPLLSKILLPVNVELLKNINVHGVAHITGSGLRKIQRINKNVKFVIDDPFESQPIFRFIQKYGNIDDEEMYQTFNMGMGLAVIVSKDDADKALKILKKKSEADVKIVGRVEKGSGVEHKKLGLKYKV